MNPSNVASISSIDISHYLHYSIDIHGAHNKECAITGLNQDNNMHVQKTPFLYGLAFAWLYCHEKFGPGAKSGPRTIFCSKNGPNGPRTKLALQNLVHVGKFSPIIY